MACVSGDQPKFCDSYQLGEEINRGGFGEVKKCTRKETGEKYAVKIMSTQGCDLDNMKYEEKICRKLNHRHIVKLVDAFMESTIAFQFQSPVHCQVQYLVFELMEGGDLFYDVAERKVYCEYDAAHSIEQVFQGVAYLHKNNIIHRDLKPENLLQNTKGKDAIVKIADFGISVDTKGVKKEIYEAHGTPSFMAPETIQELHSGTPVDMWACGVILYSLLVGQNPFIGSNREELDESIKAGTFNWLNNGDNVGKEAKDLVEKLLDVDQDSRITAKKSLKHPFIQNRKAVTSRFHRQSTIERLQEMNRNRFRAVALLVTAGVRSLKARARRKSAVSDVPQTSDSPSQEKQSLLNQEIFLASNQRQSLGVRLSESAVAELGIETKRESSAPAELEFVTAGKSPEDVELESDTAGKSPEGVELESDNAGKSPEEVEMESDNVTKSPEAVELESVTAGKSPEDVNLESDTAGKSPEADELESAIFEKSSAGVKMKANSPQEFPEAVEVETNSPCVSPKTVEPDGSGKSSEPFQSKTRSSLESLPNAALPGASGECPSALSAGHQDKQIPESIVKNKQFFKKHKPEKCKGTGYTSLGWMPEPDQYSDDEDTQL